MNGTAAHALDFDDNCYAGFVHGSAVIVPAVLAMAEAEDASGAELLTAFRRGIRSRVRGRRRRDPASVREGLVDDRRARSRRRGSRRGADPGARRRNAPVSALGLAVAGTGGAKACFGTDGKPVLCGRAAEAGVTAATLARAGITGPAGRIRGQPRLRAALQRRNLSRRLCPQDLRAHLAHAGTRRGHQAGADLPVRPCGARRRDGHHRRAKDRSGRRFGAWSCDVGPIVTAESRLPRTRQRRSRRSSACPSSIGCMLVHGDVGLAHLDPAMLGDPRSARAAMRMVGMVTTERWANRLRGGAALPGGRACHHRTRATAVV